MTQVLRSKFLVIDMRTITAKCIFFSCGLLKYDISSVILLLLYEVVLVIAHHLEHLLVLQLLTRRQDTVEALVIETVNSTPTTVW